MTNRPLADGAAPPVAAPLQVRRGVLRTGRHRLLEVQELHDNHFGTSKAGEEALARGGRS
ncbi:hypothetical protein ACFVGY_00535 [Streptomyces sp. NPDC127106]|uniref:hypothetical protein n=1 Tax=Streptomyces sp. NPDC127106 TaxID=3345360 RepID=UPI00362600EF